jgi:hypothetical protein
MSLSSEQCREIIEQLFITALLGGRIESDPKWNARRLRAACWFMGMDEARKRDWRKYTGITHTSYMSQMPWTKLLETLGSEDDTGKTIFTPGAVAGKIADMQNIAKEASEDPIFQITFSQTVIWNKWEITSRSYTQEKCETIYCLKFDGSDVDKVLGRVEGWRQSCWQWTENWARAVEVLYVLDGLGEDVFRRKG